MQIRYFIDLNGSNGVLLLLDERNSTLAARARSLALSMRIQNQWMKHLE